MRYCYYCLFPFSRDNIYIILISITANGPRNWPHNYVGMPHRARRCTSRVYGVFLFLKITKKVEYCHERGENNKKMQGNKLWVLTFGYEWYDWVWKSNKNKNIILLHMSGGSNAGSKFSSSLSRHHRVSSRHRVH